ncbi:MAG: CRISPR-associated endonuclease Cas2 [Patescibacteria group bacterium]
MSGKYGSLTSILITAIGEATGFYQWPLPYTNGWRIKQLGSISRKNCYDAVRRMKQRGLVKIVSKGGKKFLALTGEGELEKLFIKAKIVKLKEWDGKWRMIVFDIPEGASKKRDQLRWLLKRNGFMKLQASVYINPYPINREAIAYLQHTGLMAYVRIIRIDEVDNDSDLRKKFNLSKINKLH